MKKAIVFVLIVVLILVLTPSLIYAKPGWGQIQKDWDLIFNVAGSFDRNHYMKIDNLDPSTGNFTGTGYYKSNLAYSWTVSGNISDSSISFSLVYDLTSPIPGSTFDFTGTISDDGSSMSGTWESPIKTETWTGTATYKNHGDFVKNSSDKSEDAKSNNGKPVVSK